MDQVNVQGLLSESVSRGLPYAELSPQLKRVVSVKDYEARLLSHSLLNQWQYEKCQSWDVKRVLSERDYYAKMMAVCREKFLMFPYKFDLQILAYTKIMPFAHYKGILSDMIKAERSYDSLPNFTAVDCLRLTGIGRNQYINLMNKVRAKKLFKSKSLDLPATMADGAGLEPWWIMMINATVERINKECTPNELETVSTIRRMAAPHAHKLDDLHSSFDREKETPELSTLGKIAQTASSQFGIGPSKKSGAKENDVKGECLACLLDRQAVHSLYRKGILYPMINVDNDDLIVVPPLQNFVMNRTTDPFEKLLYDLLVSIDERTTVSQLSSILEKDIEDIRNAVSIYCRLGMAYKKQSAVHIQELASKGRVHGSWFGHIDKYMNVESVSPKLAPAPDPSSDSASSNTDKTDDTPKRRIAFLFDSELTAYLMMGNLGELKDHAVTLFEAGKMSDEILDLLVNQLGKVDSEGKEGEVKKYFDHAVALHKVLTGLRHNKTLQIPGCDGKLDLVRSESLNSLDVPTKMRVVDKNYACVFSMSPLSCPLSLKGCMRNYFGNPIALVASPWFHLFVACEAQVGPEMVIIKRGNHLTSLPRCVSREAGVSTIRMFTWSLESHPVILHSSNALLRINDELLWQPVLLTPNERKGSKFEIITKAFPYGPAAEDPPSPPASPRAENSLAQLLSRANEPKSNPIPFDPTSPDADTPDAPLDEGHEVQHTPVDAPPPDDASQPKPSKIDVRAEIGHLSIEEQIDWVMRRYTEEFGLQCSVGHVKMVLERKKRQPKDTLAERNAELARTRQSEFNELKDAFKKRQSPQHYLMPHVPVIGVPDTSPGVSPRVPRERNAMEESGQAGVHTTPTPATEDEILTVTPQYLHFGIPVFDPALTSSVLQQIIEHGLLSKGKMNRHTVNMQKLTLRFINFVDEHIVGGRPLMYDSKVEKSPMCSKPQASVPFPSQSLHFNGTSLQAWDGI